MHTPHAPFLGVPTARDGSLVPVDADAPCHWCVHWSFPLTQKPRTYNGVTVPLHFAEWLCYDWHVRHHQRGAPLT